MIKSIDRLVRNTKDWYLFLDCIIRNDVRLYIYIDNKFYTQEDSLVTGIKAMLAAEFSRELSRKIKNAHRRRQIKKTGFNITMPIFGWDKVDKNVYIVNEDEANVLREACELLENGYGYGRLTKYMHNKGVHGKRGKLITEVQWRKMIRSTRIYGTIILHQYEYDFDTKKRIKLPETEWIYIEDALPPIITKEHYDRLMQVLDERAKKCYLKNVPNKVGENHLSTKIYCGECDSRYHRRKGSYSGGKKATWVCSHFVKMGRIRPDNPEGCDNLIVVEDVLKALIVEAYYERFGVFCDEHIIVEEILRIARKSLDNENNEIRVEKLYKEIQKIITKKNRAIEKMLDGILSDEDYKLLAKQYDEQVDDINNEISEMRSEKQVQMSLEQRLTDVKKELKDTNLINMAYEKEVIKKVEKIIIYCDGSVKIKFDKHNVNTSNSYEDYALERSEDVYTVIKQYKFITDAEKKRNIRRQEISAYVNNHDIIINKDIQTVLGLKYGVVYAELKRLQCEGKIDYIKRVGGGFWKKI